MHPTTTSRKNALNVRTWLPEYLLGDHDWIYWFAIDRVILYLILAAPTYNESILGPTNIIGEEEHTQGQENFTPTYTYYEWSKTS
jgi:hypothetical protein